MIAVRVVSVQEQPEVARVVSSLVVRLVDNPASNKINKHAKQTDWLLNSPLQHHRLKLALH
jgi:hypothetical protein